MPKTWRSPRTILHIGACDYRRHESGSTAPFSANISAGARRSRSRSPISSSLVRTRSLSAPTTTIAQDCRPSGKQSPQLESFGCMYTRTTGIWQTVWLEGVGSAYIRDFHIEPDPSNGRVLIDAEIDGPQSDAELMITATAGNKVVGKAEVPANWRDTHAVVTLSDKRLWSVQSPFLYNLRLEVTRERQGHRLRWLVLRPAGRERTAGRPSSSTASRCFRGWCSIRDSTPTESGRRRRIAISATISSDPQVLGFNGARLHQKVFDPRFLYWADKTGLSCMGRVPELGSELRKSRGRSGRL